MKKSVLCCPFALPAMLMATTSAYAQEAPPAQGPASAVTGLSPSTPGADTGAAAGSNQALGEIVVTARKISENIQSVPLSISAVSGADLTRSSIKSVGDLKVPNLIFQAAANEPQAVTISLRGQKQNDVTLVVDPSVALYVDGLYNPRTYGARGALIDMNRIEVLRGPQGTLYGRNSTGGAIGIFSNDPTHTFGGSIAGTAGNLGLMDLQGILNVPLSNNVAARFVVDHETTNGYGRDGLNHKLNAENSTYVRAKVKGEFGDLTATLSGSYQKNDTSGGAFKISGLADAAGGLPQGGVATLEAAAELGGLTPANIAKAIGILDSYIATSQGGSHFYDTGSLHPSYSHYHGDQVGLTLEWQMTDSLKLKSITGYQHFTRASALDLDGTPFQLIDSGDSTNSTRDSYYSQELQLLGGGKRFNWVIGGYGGMENGEELSTADVAPLLSDTNPIHNDARVRNRNAAAFAQANWEFIDGWRFTGGARVSYDSRVIFSNNTNAFGCEVPAPGYSVTNVPSSPLNGPSQCPRKFKKSFTAPSWLASIDHQFTTNILGYAKVAHGYRAGGINYRGSDTIESFASFDPETVTEYEVGLKSELFDRHLRINVAGYYDDYKNIQRSISIATLSGQPASITTNAARGHIDGFEAEGAAKLLPGLTVTGGASLTVTKYTKYENQFGDRSNETFGIPKWTASAGMHYSQPVSIGTADLSIDYHWQSKVVLDPSALFPDEVTQKGYGLLDARAALTLQPADVDIAVFAKNIADKKYRVSSVSLDGALGYNYVTPGIPRTIGFQLTKRF